MYRGPVYSGRINNLRFRCPVVPGPYTVYGGHVCTPFDFNKTKVSTGGYWSFLHLIQKSDNRM
jgi:hypothetical protein